MSTNSVISRFDDALGEFKTTVSLVEAPADWLIANTDQIRATLEGLPSFSNDAPVKLIHAGLIYPRFFLYTSAHLKFCTNNPGLLDSLKAKYFKWSLDDEITQLLDHRSVSDTLWDFLSRCKDNHSHACSARAHIDKLLKLDTMCIAARILVILYDNHGRKLLLAQRGSQAQSSLNLLQALLDLPNLGAGIRSPIVSTIVELSKKSGLYPKCLDLGGVQKLGQNAVHGGGFGDVWRGEVGGHAIAIKVMRVFDASGVDKILKAFSREAVLWRQLFHPHVLPFYGVHHWPDEPSRVCLVSPWMINGNIVQYLKQTPQADRRSLVLDVALGLEYLHSFDPPIIHGDLKGTNIVITPSLRACVTDFGLCTLVHDSKVQFTPTSSGCGTMRWQAPELLRYQESGQKSERKSLASDVYSFGCVCYEIFVGSPRFSDLPAYQVIMAVVEDRRPPRPCQEFGTDIGLNDAMWELIEQCWKMIPEHRPAASDVVQELLSQSCARERGAPPCDWDEAFMSRLRSTLADDPFVSPTFSEDDSGGGGDPPDPRNSSAQGSPASPLPANKKSTITQRKASSSGTDESLTSLHGDRMRPITNQDIIIAILGPTGTGKSSFINVATGQPSTTIGHDLESCTQDVQAVSCSHPDGSGRNVVFVDTPGFDDSRRTDYDVLKSIAKWLAKTYKQRITLTGILLFHRISESRIRGTPLRNLSMFQELCGADALQNVILTTTMWDEVTDETGSKREDQLRTIFWHPMMSRGCRIARFSSTRKSAWEIIDKFDVDTRRPIKLQKEMVDEGKELSQTSAYAVLLRWWERVIAKFRDMLRKREAQPVGLSKDNDPRSAAVVKEEHSDLDQQLELAVNQKRKLDIAKHSEPSNRSLYEGEVVTMARVSRQGSKHGPKARKTKKSSHRNNRDNSFE